MSGLLIRLLKGERERTLGQLKYSRMMTWDKELELRKRLDEIDKTIQSVTWEPAE